MTAITLHTTRPDCCTCDPNICRPGQDGDDPEHCEIRSCGSCLHGCPAPAGTCCPNVR